MARRKDLERVLALDGEKLGVAETAHRFLNASSADTDKILHLLVCEPERLEVDAARFLRALSSPSTSWRHVNVTELLLRLPSDRIPDECKLGFLSSETCPIREAAGAAFKVHGRLPDALMNALVAGAPRRRRAAVFHASSGDFDAGVRCAALLVDPGRTVVEAVWRSPLLPAHVLPTAPGHPDRRIRALAAAHPALDAETRALLARDLDPHVRWSVGHSAPEDEGIVRLLAEDRFCWVRGSLISILAKGRTLPPDIAGKLLGDRSEWTRRSAARNLGELSAHETLDIMAHLDLDDPRSRRAMATVKLLGVNS